LKLWTTLSEPAPDNQEEESSLNFLYRKVLEETCGAIKASVSSALKLPLAMNLLRTHRPCNNRTGGQLTGKENVSSIYQAVKNL